MCVNGLLFNEHCSCICNDPSLANDYPRIRLYAWVGEQASDSLRKEGADHISGDCGIFASKESRICRGSYSRRAIYGKRGRWLCLDRINKRETRATHYGGEGENTKNKEKGEYKDNRTIA